MAVVGDFDPAEVKKLVTQLFGGWKPKQAFTRIASTYEDPGQVVELYRNDPNLMSSLRNRVMEEQVIDWIAERAEATEQAVGFSELMRPAA